MKYLLMLLFLTTLAAATESKEDELGVDTTSIDQRSRGNITIPAHAVRDLAGNHYVRDSIGRCCRITPTGEVTVFPPKEFLRKHPKTYLTINKSLRSEIILTVLNTYLKSSYDDIYILLATEADKCCKAHPGEITTPAPINTALNFFFCKCDVDYDKVYSRLANENASEEAFDAFFSPCSLLMREIDAYLKLALKSQVIESTE
ncbi:MAG: hypothetical protein WCJ92_02885 [Alphaproteobacteria bacterium]